MSYQYSHQDHGHPPLPPGWIAEWEPREQQYLFVDQRTGQKQWHHPEMPPQGGYDDRSRGYGGPPPSGPGGYGHGPPGGRPPPGYGSPAPPGYGSPAPQGYGGPPPPGYGGPPQGAYGGSQHGYGSPPPQEEKKNHNLAYGIGGGLLGAAAGAWAMHEYDERK